MCVFFSNSFSCFFSLGFFFIHSLILCWNGQSSYKTCTIKGDCIVLAISLLTRWSGDNTNGNVALDSRAQQFEKLKCRECACKLHSFFLPISLSLYLYFPLLFMSIIIFNRRFAFAFFRRLSHWLFPFLCLSHARNWALLALPISFLFSISNILRLKNKTH